MTFFKLFLYIKISFLLQYKRTSELCRYNNFYYRTLLILRYPNYYKKYRTFKYIISYYKIYLYVTCICYIYLYVTCAFEDFWKILLYVCVLLCVLLCVCVQWSPWSATSVSS